MLTASKKVINGWAMYDWAFSVYNLVITTTFFPIYFTKATQEHLVLIISLSRPDIYQLIALRLFAVGGLSDHLHPLPHPYLYRRHTGE